MDVAELDLIVDSSEVRAATKDLDKLAAASDRASKQARDAQGRFIKLGNDLDQVKVKTIGLGGAMAFALKQVAALSAASAGLFAVGQGIKSIAEFDQNMTELRGTITTTTEEMEMLRQMAKQLGATTKFSAGQAAQAELELARSGLKANEVLDVTPQVLSLATAATLELGQAAGYTTQILAQFSLRTDQAGRVADVLVKGANSAATTVPELADALAQAGTVAARSGKSFEETSAAIAILQSNGLKGQVAGTALRSAMAALLNPSGRAAQILEKLGSRIGRTAKDFDISKKSFGEVFGLLSQAGASTKDLSAIFGTEGFTAAGILAGSTEQLKLLDEALNGSQGAAEELAKIMADTLPGAFDGLTSAIESLFLQAGDAGLTKVLKEILQLAADTITILSGMAGAALDTTSAANTLANAIEAASVGLAAFVAILAVQKLVNMAKGIGGVTGAFKAMTAALRANPIFAIASLISILVFSLIELSEEFVNIGGTSIRIGNLMTAAWEEVTKLLAESWEWAKEQVSAALESISETFSEIWDGIKRTFFQVVDVLVSAWNGTTDDLGSTWQNTWRDILSFFKTVVNKLIGLVVSLVQVWIIQFTRAAGVIQSFLNIDTDDLEGSADRIKTALSNAFDFSSFASEAASTFRENWDKDFVGMGVELAGKAADAIVGTFGDKLSGIGDRVLERAKELQELEDAAKKEKSSRGGVVRQGTAQSTAVDVDRAEQAVEQAKKAREDLQGLLNSLRREIDSVGLTDVDKERVELLLQVRDIVKGILGVKGDIFSKDQEQKLERVNEAVTGLFDELQRAKEFQRLGDEGVKAFDTIKKAASDSKEVLSEAFATDSQRELLAVQREFQVELEAVNALLEEQLRLGIGTEQAARQRRQEVDRQLQDIANNRIAADAIAIIQDNLLSLNDTLRSTFLALEETLFTPRFLQGATSLKDQLIAPFKAMEEQLERLRASGKITEQAYQASMDKIKEATRAAGQVAESALVLERVQSFTAAIAQSFGSMFQEIILGTKTAQEAAAEFFAAVASIALQKIIIEPFVDLLTSGITKAFSQASGLQASAIAAGATLQGAATAVGATIVGSATQAAAILRGAAAANATSSAVGGVAKVAGAAAANGAVYHRGVLAFAAGGVLQNATPVQAGASSAGGVLTGPHTFPLRGGNVGLAGEAGPEAIMPLVRIGGQLAVMSDRGPLPLARHGGKLGVTAFADGGILPGPDARKDLVQPSGNDRQFATGRRSPSTVSNQSFTFNVTTPSPEGFKASQSQLVRQMKKVGGGR